MLEKSTKQTLRSHRVRLKKKYGQNFCIDEGVLEDIIAAAGLTADSQVLEIGPGAGALTARMCDVAGQVTAIEVDPDMVGILRRELASCPKLDIIHADIMQWDGIAALPRPLKVVANLPYYITTPILTRLLEHKECIGDITVMVQKEVALRMCAEPSSRDYGALSLFIQYHTEPVLVRTVPGSAFLPPPKVDSAVVHMRMLEAPRVEVDSEADFFAMLRASFSQRRKTLANSLSNHSVFNLDKSGILRAIDRAGFLPTVRPEELSLFDFRRLYECLRE